MKYCTNCGTQLSDDAKFCSVCGTRQEAPKAPEPKPEKPKRPAAPRKPASQEVKPDNNGEVFFTATEEEGEVVLSSWGSPKNQQQQAPPRQQQAPPQQQTQPRQQQYTAPPKQQYTAPPQRPVAPPQQQPKKKRGFFSWLIIILLILITLYFLGSILEGCKNINLPPDPGTPVPEPHEGVFVCGNDTLVFNGDGKTISWHLAEEGSNVPDCVKELGTQGSGTYAFLFSHGLARYDVAENLLIYKDSLQNTYLMLSIPTKDTLISIIADKGAIFEFRKIR